MFDYTKEELEDISIKSTKSQGARDFTEAKLEAIAYLLSDGYLDLLKNAIYARISTSTYNKNKHYKAIELLERL